MNQDPTPLLPWFPWVTCTTFNNKKHGITCSVLFLIADMFRSTLAWAFLPDITDCVHTAVCSHKVTGLSLTLFFVQCYIYADCCGKGADFLSVVASAADPGLLPAAAEAWCKTQPQTTARQSRVSNVMLTMWMSTQTARPFLARHSLFYDMRLWYCWLYFGRVSHNS